MLTSLNDSTILSDKNIFWITIEIVFFFFLYLVLNLSKEYFLIFNGILFHKA